jgi:hypothetical protein
MVLLDGIYTVSADLTINRNMRADTNARPTFVHEDGYPPTVGIGNGVTVDGIWFGGLRPASDAGSRTISMGVNAIVRDCTLFGYINGIQNGDNAHGNTYRRNRFVSCGYGAFQHPLYVANMNSTLPEHGVLSEENIMVGCEGFSVHYYHEPAYGLAQYNFIGDAQDGLALQGDADGPVSGNRNIIWGATGSPLYDICVSGSCDHNVWHDCSQPSAGGAGTFDNNYFHGVTTNGTNPATWNDSDVETNFGKTPAQIDAAIAALETAFAQTVQQIHDDATIETHFATLKAVIDTWKVQ